MALFARSSRLLFAPRMPVVVASRAIMTSRVAYSEPPKKKAAAAPAAAAPAAPKQAAPAAEVPLDSQFAFRGIPGRYARILLEFARKHGQDKTVREDLNSLNQAIQDNYSLRSMFHRVPLDSLGASDITKILLEELRSKGHVHHFGAIAKTYEAASRVVNNEQHLTLVTTRPLTTAENANVLKLLKTDYAPTSEIVLTNDVDPSIVGGFVIHTDDMVCDLSLKTLLSRWYSGQEEEIQLEHEKRLSAIQQSIRTPEIPRNTAFMERVQAGVAHLEKQTGMSELQH